MAKVLKRTGFSPGKSLQDFTKEARSLLWRMDDGVAEQKVNYHKWQARIKELQEESGLEKKVATVQAAKEFSILLPLFRKFNISKYDLDLDDKGRVGPAVSQEKLKEIVNENKKLSRLEEIEWACEAAGNFKRTGEMPETCPNDAAFFLLEQAIEEGKHFLDKVVQMTCKNMDAADQQRKANLSGRRCIEEIEAMLEIIEKKKEPEKKKQWITKDAEGNKS